MPENIQDDIDPAATLAAPQPFGMRRRHYMILRVALALGIVVVGVTLHHHGAAYDVIRGVYFVAIVALVVWRVRSRRSRRHLRQS